MLFQVSIRFPITHSHLEGFVGRMVKHMRGTKPEHGYFDIDIDQLPIYECSCSVCNGVILRRARNSSTRGVGRSAYGAGGYNGSSFSMRSGTFDGLPSLSRKRSDGATEIFYQEGSVDMNDPNHGHAVIKNGRLVYKRRPGEENPVINLE